MKSIALIPAAGMGRRMGAAINKQYLLLDEKPILAHTLELFQKADFIDEIFVVVPVEEIEHCRVQVVEKYGIDKVRQIVAGGAERQDSVLNGLRALDCDDDDVVLIHDGVRPFIQPAMVLHSIEMAREHDGALVAVPVKDTVKMVKDAFVTSTPLRNYLWLAQTPQAFRYKVIRAAHERAAVEEFSGTDDASLLERIGGKVHVVIGDYRNIKITTPEDLILAEAFLNDLKRERCKEQFMRIGHGYDVHRLVAGRKLILGGVEIPHETGLLGHSDADVLLHAICDAILGAIGKGDIGKHFPDSDPAYKGISSISLLQQVMLLAKGHGYQIGNVDATIVAQRPKLAPFITQMVTNISAALGTGSDRVNVKATTTEELGFAGRTEGIAAYSVVLLEREQG